MAETNPEIINYALKKKIIEAIKDYTKDYRQQLLVFEYVTNGGSQKKAMKIAGYTDKSHALVSQTINTDKFQNAISVARDILGKATEKVLITKNQILQEWVDIALDSKSKKFEKLKATELIAKHLCMFPKENSDGNLTQIVVNADKKDIESVFKNMIETKIPKMINIDRNEQEIIEMKNEFGVQTYQQ